MNQRLPSLPLFLISILAACAAAQTYIDTKPYRCNPASPHSVVQCDGGVQTLGILTTARFYLVATNLGLEDGGGSIVTVRTDGTSPSLTFGSAGVPLVVGASVVSTNQVDAGVRAICSFGFVGTFECRQ
jgi:hypothetical protein